MTETRKGESGFPPFRSGRMFNIGSDWYFATREGDRGPFESKEEAEAELKLYLREQALAHERIIGDSD